MPWHKPAGLIQDKDTTAIYCGDIRSFSVRRVFNGI